MTVTSNTTRTHKRLTVKISNTKKEGEKSVYPKEVKYVKQRLGWSPLRGTQREYSSKPLKHSIVKRVLVFKRSIWAYLYPL